MKRLLLLLCIFFIPMKSGYAITVKDYNTLKGYRESDPSDDWPEYVISSYLRGAMDAYTYSSAYNIDNNNGRFYCLPEALVLNTKQIESILDKFIDEKNVDEGDSLSLILFFSLRDTFPCKK